MITSRFPQIVFLLTALLVGGAAAPLTTPTSPSGDWTDWRGPARDGRSTESGLPTRWTLDGDNLAWKVPYGSRSTPIVLGDRLYLQNAAGEGDTLQERVMCFNANTGELLWEHRFNVYQSDVPPHRVGWASPVGDPKTGNVFAYGVGGVLLSLNKEGELLWGRSLGEDFGLVTTHGGRTASPVIEGDLLIVSGVNSGWGNQARGAQRFFAFDKSTGETIWVSLPGGRPYDTTYSPPIGVDINGTRLLIAGGGDGAVHALKPQTGEPVWKYEFSKRGINSGTVLKGTTAIVSHGEENLANSEMGFIAAIDAAAIGQIGQDQVKWQELGFLGGYSSPVIDDDFIYQVDNSANLVAFDLETGNRLWSLNLGTIQRASPVLADGKLYVGTVNGKFYIIRPGDESAEVLSEVQLGSQSEIEEIFASVAISRGRVYLASSRALYCIGKGSESTEGPEGPAGPVGNALLAPPAREAGSPTHVQVVPTELVLAPGNSVQFQARLFDDRGRLVGVGEASWSLDGLQGRLDTAGTFTAAAGQFGKYGQAGQVKATVGDISGVARVRVIPPLPWKEDFEAIPVDKVPRHWVNATGKYLVREEDGSKILVKRADNPFLKRARAYLGPSDWSNYTVAVDVRSFEKRRQMGDAGVIAQRYALVLFGNHQRLELHAWQPETKRSVRAPFTWKPDAWYRVKLEVQNLSDGTTRARGKAWLASEPEPAEWTVERIDPVPNREGSPGLYANAINEVFFDNLEVRENQ